MATPSSNSQSNAKALLGSGKTQVVLPDSKQNYTLNIPKESVAHVAAVDVDLIVTLKTGEIIVLAEAGMLAMSNSQIEIHYTNGQGIASDLLTQSGSTTLPATADLTVAYTGKVDAPITKEEDVKGTSQGASTSSGSGISMHVEAKTNDLVEKTLKSYQTVSTVSLPNFQKYDVPPNPSSGAGSSKPNDEKYTLEQNLGKANPFSVAFLSDASTSVAGNIFYGAYGSVQAQTVFWVSYPIAMVLIHFRLNNFCSHLKMRKQKFMIYPINMLCMR